MTAAPSVAELLILTGMSGSGKSVALHALEDAGYYCVDNLPPELLAPLLALESARGPRRLAVAVDVRSGESLPQLPLLLHRLTSLPLRLIFLDANDDTLVRRFSETRRRHPLSRHGEGGDTQALTHAIARERERRKDKRSIPVAIHACLP